MKYARVKPYRQHRYHCPHKISYDPEMTCWENLAAAILVQAANDAGKVREKDLAYVDNQWIKREELASFFASAWCEALLGMTHLTSGDIRKRVGL